MNNYNPKIKIEKNNIILENTFPFSLDQTLDCGQAFRWEKDNSNIWHGIAFNKSLSLKQENSKITFFNTSEDDFNLIWRKYFDIDRNYFEIINTVSKNDILKEAIKYAGGIRILKQDPWETLCSFIISQNNNIPRIKAIITRLCENFGEKAESGYCFPSADKISKLSLEDLAPLRCGFRARYILDAAKKVAENEIDLNALYSLPINEARTELMKICGVGPKVADCTLLFGFNRIEAFPQDVWIKRAMKKLFNGVLPKEAEQYAGIVQQYIFHYARITKLDI